MYATHSHDLFYITVKYHDYIPKGIQVMERTQNMHKKASKAQKVLRGKLSFLHGTHHHDLFYITVKYHQNIPNGFQVIKWTRKCLRMDVRTDARLIAISPEPFSRGIKRVKLTAFSIILSLSFFCAWYFFGERAAFTSFLQGNSFCLCSLITRSCFGFFELVSALHICIIRFMI